MKRLMLLLLIPVTIMAQSIPPPSLVYVLVSGVPYPVTSPLTTGQLPFTPPSVLAKCMNGNLIVDCNFGGASSANIYTANPMPQADSVTSIGGNGIQAFGDSITAGTGATTAYPSIIGTDLNISVTNNAVSGDTAGDQTFHVYTAINPQDESNPPAISMIGTNDMLLAGANGVATFKKYQYASAIWAAISFTNKVFLNPTSGITYTGSWTVDSSWVAATFGVVSATGTASYPAIVGPSGVFYVPYKMSATPGAFTVSIDGVLATDTVGGSSTVSSNWSGDVPAHQSQAVGAARYVTTPGSHTLLVSWVSGTASVMGFAFPPVLRYRGSAAPRYFMGGVPPEGGNANASTIALYNSTSLAVSQQLVNDGLFVPFVDVNRALDFNLDFVSVTTQNCTGGSATPVHPNQCGQQHLAQVFESLIGTPRQLPSPFSTTQQIWNNNSGNTFSNSAPVSGVKNFGLGGDNFLSYNGFEYDTLNATYATTTNYGISTEVSWKTCVSGYSNPNTCTTRAWLDASGNLNLTGLFKEPLTTPASSSAACTTGQAAWDTGFVYICTATNTWKRVAIATW